MGGTLENEARTTVSATAWIGAGAARAGSRVPTMLAPQGEPRGQVFPSGGRGSCSWPSSATADASPCRWAAVASDARAGPVGAASMAAAPPAAARGQFGAGAGIQPPAPSMIVATSLRMIEG